MFDMLRSSSKRQRANFKNATSSMRRCWRTACGEARRQPINMLIINDFFKEHYPHFAAQRSSESLSGRSPIERKLKTYSNFLNLFFPHLGAP